LLLHLVVKISSHVVLYAQVSVVYLKAPWIGSCKRMILAKNVYFFGSNFGLRYKLETWTYSTMWLHISTTKCKNDNFALYILYLTM